MQLSQGGILELVHSFQWFSILLLVILFGAVYSQKYQAARKDIFFVFYY